MTAKAAEARVDEGTDDPLLDTVSVAIKKMLARAKERGYVTPDEIGEAMPPDEVTSEQLEDTMAMLSEMGINIVESEESEEPAEKPRPPEKAAPAAPPPPSAASADPGFTDDPVRMYLREMGRVELLSREGEIAIAKRIEVGRERMIRAIGESPLTLHAIVGWRDKLHERDILLRDVVDLETTYGSSTGAEAAPRQGRGGEEGQRRRRRGGRGRGRRGRGQRGQPFALGHGTGAAACRHGHLRQDRPGQQAAEAGPGRLSRRQAAGRGAGAVGAAPLRAGQPRRPPPAGRCPPAQQPHRRDGGRALRLQRPPHLPGKRPAQDGRPARRQAPRVPRPPCRGRARARLAGTGLQPARARLENLRAPRRRAHPRDAGRDRPAGADRRPRHRRLQAHRARGSEKRKGGRPGQEGDGRGQSAPGDLHRQEIHQSRPAIPGSDPGRAISA